MYKNAPRGRTDDGAAFFPDPGSGPIRAPDELAELAAEEFLQSATSGEEVGEDVRDEIVTEELGGPFVEDRASMELARDVDGSNPKDATREPFPTAMRAPR
jgi:hypothetical protein